MKPIAIITGAGRGIGRATAEELTRRGYALALAGRQEQALRETADGIAAAGTLAAQAADGGSPLIFPADLTDPRQCQRLVDAVLERFGRVDGLINNAGLAPVQPLATMDISTWRAVLDTNLSAAFYLSRFLWPAFRKQGAGVIVNISSPAAYDPFPGLGAYGAAKAGLNVLTLMLAREGAAIGVRVHGISPSATETEMFRGIMTPQQVPTETILAPADVARMVGLCVSGELRYTSGEVIGMRKQP